MKELEPYYDSVSSATLFRNEKFLPIPDLPDELITSADWQNAEDNTARLRAIVSGDPVSDTYGDLPTQIETLAMENAAKRLGVYGISGSIQATALPGLLASSRLASHIIKTPLQRADRLSECVGCNVYFKREDLQLTRSFKVRGAFNRMQQLNVDERQAGVLAASAGNHAQGVALAGKHLRIDTLVVMPENAESVKIEAVRNYGAKIILRGQNYTQAYEYSQVLQRESGRTFIHPFNDVEVIAGADGLGIEMYRQNPVSTHIFVPVGGGGLLAGVARATKSMDHTKKVIGVEPDDSNAMQLARRAGGPIMMEHSPGIFADGAAVEIVGENTFALANKYAEDVISVSKDEIIEAMVAFWEETNSVLEPTGALAIAGAQKYARQQPPKNSDTYITICSGGNLSLAKLSHSLERANYLFSKRAQKDDTLGAERPQQIHKFHSNVVGLPIYETRAASS